MKAAHRKELQTNALADKVGGILKGAKSYAGAIWALLIIGGVAYAFYWWYSWNYQSRVGLAWIDYFNRAENPAPSDEKGAPADALLKVASDRKGTPAERAAKLAAADLYYRAGYEKLDRGPQLAKDHLNKAIELYTEIAQNPGECKDVGLRAMIGLAKSQECLGDIEAARGTYQRAIQQYGKHFRAGEHGPAHPLISDAETALAFLDTGTGRELYKDWMTRHGITSPGSTEPPPDPKPDPGRTEPPPPPSGTEPDKKPETIPPKPIERPSEPMSP